MSTQVAQTILAQLGGSKFIAMTGAHSLSGGNNALGMRVGKNPKRVTGVRIELAADDTYTLVALASRPFPVCVAETYRSEGLYADNLADAFESATGLRVSL